jgi:hypothetical protein
MMGTKDKQIETGMTVSIKENLSIKFLINNADGKC